MISLGGVELLQPDRATLDRLESGTVMHELWQFPPRLPGPVLARLGCPPPWPDWFAARLNTLYWPQGASRFAWGYYFVNESKLEELRALAFRPENYAPLALKLDDGRHAVETDLYILPSRPLDKVEGLPGAHLLTLVDERYFWWQRGGAVPVYPGYTTWADLDEEIGDLWGVAIEADDVHADYGLPDVCFSTSYETVPLLLDAVAEACGHKVVRDLDGTLRALTLDSSRTRLETNLRDANARLSGGRISLSSRVEADAALPETVKVAFGALANGSASYSPYVKSVAVADLPALGLTGLGDATGAPDTSHTIKRPEVALSPLSPGNGTALDALALRCALDWVGHRLGHLDECFEGVCDWDMEGLTALLEYEHCPEYLRTRARRGPWELSPSRQGPGLELVSGGTTYYQGGNYTYGGGTTTFRDGNITVFEGGSELIAEDGTPVLYEDGTAVLVPTTAVSYLITEGGTAVFYEDETGILLQQGGGSSVLFSLTDFHLNSSAISVYETLNIIGTGSVVYAVGVEFCSLWWLCYETLPTVSTPQTQLTISTARTVSRIPVTGGVPVYGVAAPADPTRPLTVYLINTGTGTGTLYDEDGGASSTDQVILPNGLATFPWLPGSRIDLYWDVVEQKWRLVTYPSVAAGGVPGGQTVTGGTDSGDSLTLSSTTDASKGGVYFDEGEWAVFDEITPPDPPAAGKVAVYAKDGSLWAMDDAGNEYDLAATGGGTLIDSEVAFSAVSSVSFGLTGYRYYKIVGYDLQSSVAGMGATLQMRTSTDGGFSWDSGGTDYNTNGANAAQIAVGAIATDAGADAGFFEMTAFNLSGTVVNKAFSWLFTNTGGGAATTANMGVRNSTADIDAVDFLCSAGTFKGTILVYGYN
jgi:hypothetical protein